MNQMTWLWLQFRNQIYRRTHSLQIKIAQLGNSDDLQVGEQVVAIGNALGYGQSVTSGWISALNRNYFDR